MMGKVLNVWGRFLAIILIVATASGATAGTNASRPNIVVILADDLGYSDIGCFGSEISTPNLDQLAAEGVQFTQFYTTPRCCPTRAALLTGLYPHQAGIGSMMEDRGVPGYRGELNPHAPTVAEVLRTAGYHTLMAGKWHVSHIAFDGKRQLNFESDGPFWDHQKNWPQQRGFDEYFGTIHGVNSYYDPFSLVRGNQVIHPEAKDFYYTDAITDAAVADIEKSARGEKPFFLYVAYTAPHWPLQAPEADIAKYRERYLAGWDQIRTNRYQRQIELGIIDKTWPLSPRDERVPAWSEVKDKAWEANRMATYAAMVERMDRGIGRITAKLKETGADQNTLVMFMSDNGACDEVIRPEWYDVPSRMRDGRPVKVGNQNHNVFAGPDDVWQSYGPGWANVGNTPFRLYKHFVHEGGIATPFIARWPAVITTNGVKSRATGHVTDIMATCVDLAGAKLPETFQGEKTLPLEGHSLRPIFQGQPRPQPTPFFWEHEGHRGIRLNNWKLVSRHRGDWELYDVETDRTEARDLATRFPDKVKQMAALYEDWARRCQVIAPENLPAVRPIVPAPAVSPTTGGK
jgi:arylsulfatase A-like enzyme